MSVMLARRRPVTVVMMADACRRKVQLTTRMVLLMMMIVELLKFKEEKRKMTPEIEGQRSIRNRSSIQPKWHFFFAYAILRCYLISALFETDLKIIIAIWT